MTPPDNKSLEDSIIEIMWEAIAPKAKVIGEDAPKSEIMETIIKYWQKKELSEPANQILSLIKARLEREAVALEDWPTQAEHSIVEAIPLESINKLLGDS